MSHDNAAQALLDAAPLVTLGSYDLVGTAEQALAFAAGQVTLMSTKAGLSTTLVDSSHDFVGQLGLAERSGVDAGADILATGGSGAAVATAAAAWPAVVAGVVILGALGAGTWYVLHKRKNARVATEDDQPVVEMVLAEAEAVVDAEYARLRETTRKP